MYNLMTGANGDENLFKALTTASTLLLKLGLFIYLFIYYIQLLV
jgi:hypothetical protein